jgi:molybdopterin converting factor small subunit
MHELELPLNEGCSVSDVIAHLEQRFPALSLEVENVLVTVNHQEASLSRILRPGDVVAFLPHIGGG